MGSSLKFGTSGLRGLAAELAGAEARRYVAGFLRHLAGSPTGQVVQRVYLARDRRASSAGIVADCAAAVRGAGLVPVDCGVLPTPALALQAVATAGAGIMVTGSHIPADRNGLKFYTPAGEITKDDEAGILARLPPAAPDAVAGGLEDGFAAAGDRYRQRYRRFLAADALQGWRIGVFEHSSVATDQLCSLLYRAGAGVVRLGRSAAFVPVDTEAFGDAIYADRHDWLARHRLDAVISTDGDGDRPLVIDAHGDFVRGDVLGLVAARYLGADCVVTPVTSNSAIEALGAFRHVVRTRVGSPYVIAGMEEAARAGGVIVGFEANGGTLLGSPVTVNGRRLGPLPTRDAILPILALLASAAEGRMRIADLVTALAVRPALSERLTEVPVERSAAFVRRLAEDADYARTFFAPQGEVAELSAIDGPRFTLASGDVVHYRPSGNAPELRCYVEGATPERAEALLRWGLEAAAQAVRG